MARIQRAFAALSLLLVLLFMAAPILTPTSASAASPTTHSGRLGGSQASFNTRFGKGSGSASKGITYHATGYTSIVVKFDKDRAVDIAVTSEAGVSWASDQALSSALNFLPKDAKFDVTQHDTGDGRWEFACSSKDLGTQFSAKDYSRLKHKGSPGDCYDLASPDSPTTINAIELSIGRAGSLDRPTPTPQPTPTLEPTATPDTSTFIGQDGCTYMTATGALVSCPPPPTAEPAPVQPGGGATAQCNDGTYSYSQHASGTCSHHGGVAVWINYPG